MKAKSSRLERGFFRLWEAASADFPQPEREFRFHPVRRWRFDFAWPAYRLAVEIDGGIFVNGRHGRGLQFSADCEKLNAAVLLGWRVLRYTTIDMRQRPVQVIEEVQGVLREGRRLRIPDQQKFF